MLKKKSRLTVAQFDQCFKSGKRFHTPSLQIIYTPHNQFHAAAVVGKKVYKRAVDRNTVRRALYNTLYRFCMSSDLTGVFIIVAKPKAKTISKKELQQELLEQMTVIEKRL